MSANIDFNNLSTNLKIQLRTPEEQEEGNEKLLPIGVQTPLRFNASSIKSGLKMHFYPQDQVKDNLKNLLMTNYGERPIEIDYGANLISLSFDQTEDILANQAAILINRAVKKFMPFVTLKNLSLSMVKKKDLENSPDNKYIIIKILYSVPQAEIIDDELTLIIR